MIRPNRITVYMGLFTLSSVLLLWGCTATGRRSHDPCDHYARTAVSQNQQNLGRRCGFTGIGWHSDYNAHYQWCTNVPRELADQEIRRRGEDLRQCR